jgi:hypothetical protein
MESNKLKLALANAIVEKLWLKGLIDDEQKERLKEKNSLKILC